MKEAPIPTADAERCAALESLEILDTAPEERFDRITRLARKLFGVPIVLVSLVDRERQWFKSRQGLEATETPRSVSFCGHAISSDETFVVEDSLQDERFADNPLVTDEPHVRFYAGQPLRSRLGYRVGTLCLIDREPRSFSGEDRELLRDLAFQVEHELNDKRDLGGVIERALSSLGGEHDIGWRSTFWAVIAGHFSTRTGAAVAASVVALLAVLGGWLWDSQQLENYRADVNRAAAQQMGVVRGALETALNSKLHLVHGLSGYVLAGGATEESTFTRFAAELAGEVRGIRSLQLAPGGVVTHVWPVEMNASAIGHDLLADPQRRALAELAISTRELWVAGPLQLIQGGVALAGRLPIFQRDETSQERFWGFATVLVDVPDLLEEVGLGGQTGDRFRFALRGSDSRGGVGPVFHGQPALFENSPVTGIVSLPAGYWELAVAPARGWPTSWPGAASFRAFVAAIALILASLIYFLFRLPSNLRNAIQNATSAVDSMHTRFRDAIESLEDGFAIYDATDRLVACNERLRELYEPCRQRIHEGRRYEELLRDAIGRGLVSSLDTHDEDACERYVALAMNAHRSRNSSNEQRLSTGIVVRVSERKMRDGGTVSIHKNISEEHRNEAALVEARERAEQANAAKSAFLATVSHEVRTPLNGVLGLLSVLRADRTLSSQQATYVKTAHESATHLLAILNEILDLSKLESNRLELDIGPFIPAEMLRGTADLVRAQADDKGLELRVAISPELERPARGDSGRLRQVLLNLLNNAVKFTDSGFVALRATGTANRDGKIVLDVEVEDSGVGFDPADSEKLFEAFSQLDRDSDRRFMGTGLGLTICQRLVKLMGGRIEATAVPGVGARFRVHLTLESGSVEDLDRTGELAAPPLPKDFRDAPMRVLLAEDSPTNQLVIRAMLKDTGYTVDAVHNGREAVTALSQLPYDVVLMDVQMPELDGLDATRAIRKQEHGTYVPIIALTANAMSGDRERFIEAGMDDFLAKPVDKSQLLAALFRWCNVASPGEPRDEGSDQAEPARSRRRNPPESQEVNS